MKEARYYVRLDNNKVRCALCPHLCTIYNGEYGLCGARKNEKGRLYSLVYGRPSATNIDPIEKKPLFHFLPGEKTFSLGTLGCNLGCLHCQNFGISQRRAENAGGEITPKEVVNKAMMNKCNIISYTYNEPTVFFEYMLDIAKIAKKKGIKNTVVSNGYINPGPLMEMLPLISAANIDLKGFNKKFYRELCKATLDPVLKTMKILSKQKNIILEVTNLIIPTKNDDLKEIESMVAWINKNLGRHIPIHFSRFHPMYKLTNIPPTKTEVLIKAREIAKKYLDYVYVGNVLYTDDGENTYCPECKSLLIRRHGYNIENIKSKCDCGFILYGEY